jgi:hypothetical protein
MLPHTVTVFNKDSHDNYHKAVIHGVLWESVKGSVNRKTGSSSADGFRLTIPMKAEGYAEPEKWLGLSDKAGFWTLKPKDIVVFGENEDLYIKSAKDIACIQNAMTISSVDFKAFGSSLDHFEVSGK